MKISKRAFIVTGAASGLFMTTTMAGFTPEVQLSLAQTMLNCETIRLDGALRMAPK